MHGYGWARFNTAWSSSTDKTMETVANLTRRVKQMLADEKAEKLRPPSEPLVPDAAMKRLKNARSADDSGELLAREAPGKNGGDSGGGCSVASR